MKNHLLRELHNLIENLENLESQETELYRERINYGAISLELEMRYAAAQENAWDTNLAVLESYSELLHELSKGDLLVDYENNLYLVLGCSNHMLTVFDVNHRTIQVEDSVFLYGIQRIIDIAENWTDKSKF